MMSHAKIPQGTSSALDWARYYVSRGWSAVPARTGTKFPAGEWLRYQTTTPTDQQLVDWFGQQGFTRLGLVTGASSGVIVADFDGETGMETLSRLDSRGFPTSIRQFTPSGGCHVLLKHPGLYVPTRKWRESPWRDQLPGMDIRGDGGFIMAAPSVGAEYGEYAWDVDAHPADAVLADAPAVFADLICQSATPSSTGGKDLPLSRAPGPLGLDLGQINDGRETYMRNTVLAVTRGLYDSLGRMPTEQEVFEEGWPQYSARVDLSRAGRGEHEFRAKVRYTLARLARGSIPSFTSPAGSAEPVMATAEAPAVGEAKEALWIDAEDPTLADIPKRPWAVPSYLMRGSVSVLSGQGAGGKSSLVVAWTLAMAKGQAIGDFVPPRPMLAVNYNVEDDQDEQRRRYSAAMLAQNVPGDVVRRIIRCGPYDIGTLFERDEKGRLVGTEALQRLAKLVSESGADVLICDPLAELHTEEENDNTAMRAVVAAFRSMAKRLDIAILLLHHDRKGTNAPGDMDRMRGASAITGAVRVMLTLTTMSQEEADKFGIPPEDRRRHFRVDGAKSNYAIASDAEWWKLTGYDIPNGETVAAAMPWQALSLFGSLPMGVIVQALDSLSAGRPNGDLWSPRKEARDGWGGRVLADIAAVTDSQASEIIKQWLKSGVLKIEKFRNSNRMERDGLTVYRTKLSEMRQQTKGANGHDDA